jgi:hypothetical protein
MTPLEIELLLHVYARAGEIENRDAPAVRDALTNFLRDDLIALKQVHEPGRHPFEIMPRGEALVGHLCDVPLPVSHWARPQRRCPGGGWCERASCNAHDSCDRI